MTDFQTWIRSLRVACEGQRAILSTRNQFEAVWVSIVSAATSPLAAVLWEISRDGPFVSVTIGETSLGKADYSHTLSPGIGEGSRCKVYIWAKERIDQQQADFDPALTIEALSDLIRAFWMPDLRDATSRLISLHTPATSRIIDNSLQGLLSDREILCTFFCDLDHFKKVNDDFDQQTGDRVILEFAAILDEVVGPIGVALHKGGDEFEILYPTSSADHALLLARRIMQKVKCYDFDVGDLEIRVSAGIAIH